MSLTRDARAASIVGQHLSEQVALHPKANALDGKAQCFHIRAEGAISEVEYGSDHLLFGSLWTAYNTRKEELRATK